MQPGLLDFGRAPGGPPLVCWRRIAAGGAAGGAPGLRVPAAAELPGGHGPAAARRAGGVGDGWTCGATKTRNYPKSGLLKRYILPL